MRLLASIPVPVNLSRYREIPTPCRPGLLNGIAPLRRPGAITSSAFDRFALQLSAPLQAFRLKRETARCLVAATAAINVVRALTPAERRRDLDGLRTTLRLSGHDAETLDTSLAHAAVAAESVLGLTPRENQIIASHALSRGRFVEMPTGEGKTLAVAMAAIVAALDGTPVHILTANDYLAARDASFLQPLYAALGLSSACSLPTMSDDERRAAYASDIVHVTGKQVAFDWMRDARASGSDAQRLEARLGILTSPPLGPSPTPAPAPMLRGLCFAVVDEADSLLIDEARTPLVLAAERAESSTLDAELVVALGLAEQLVDGADFCIDRQRRLIELRSEGEQALENLATRMPGTWQSARFRDERVRQALTALHLFHRDRDYIVRDDTLQLVDEQSGRTLPDRRLPHGLHRLLELKEHSRTTAECDVVASMPFQRFFSRYVSLSGTSGTLEEVSAELTRHYGAALLRVTPERPSQRCELTPKVVANRATQLDVLVAELRLCRLLGRPVLVGTRSVEQSSGVAATLAAYGLPHRVLSASQDSEEAAIVATAGEAGQLTVATNMAGRGTDIPLGDGVAERGGLHVISLAFNDARRIDRQLAGRAARQGQPGSYRHIVSLDDADLRAAMPGLLLAIVHRLVDVTEHGGEGSKDSTGSLAGLAGRLAYRCVALAQRRIEWRHARERRAALASEEQLGHHVAIGGSLDHPG